MRYANSYAKKITRIGAMISFDKTAPVNQHHGEHYSRLRRDDVNTSNSPRHIAALVQRNWQSLIK